MTSIYLSQGCLLKTYSAATKGDKTIVKIEIESADHMAAGFLLKDLQEMLARQKAEAKQKAEPARRKAPLALPAPPLQLPYFGDDQ